MTHKKNNYRWLFLDLDGTIVTKDYILPDKTVGIIAELQKRLAVSVATGRSYKGAKNFLEKLQIDKPVILQNGGIIYNPSDQSSEKMFQVSPESAKIFIELADRYNLSFKMHTEDDTAYKSKDTEWEDGEMLKSIDVTIPEMMSLIGSGPIKFVIYSDENKMKNFLSETVSHFSGSLNDVRMFKSGLHFWEILNKNTSKGSALKVLSQRFNIPLEQIIALGDYDNDIEMVSYAGLGICVDTASKNLIGHSSLQIPGPEQFGIEALLKIIN